MLNITLRTYTYIELTFELIIVTLQINFVRE